MKIMASIHYLYVYVQKIDHLTKKRRCNEGGNLLSKKQI